MKPFYFYFLLFSSIVLAQAPTIQWQDVYGGTSHDRFHCAVQTLDGGYVVTGYAMSADGDIVSSHGNSELLLVKYDSLGVISWKKAFGGSGSDKGNAVRQTSDGGFIICGQTTSADGDASVTHLNGDYWVIKTDASGNITWQKSYGGNSFDEAFDIRQTFDGGYIVIGSVQGAPNGDVTNHYSTGTPDVWILKIDAVGNKQWQKNYGGNGEDIGRTILQLPDGGYVFSAGTNSCGQDVVGLHDPFNCTGSFVNYDFWVVKIDADGDFIWKTTLGTNGPDSPLASQNSMALTNDGGVIVCGQSVSAWSPQQSDDLDYMIYKLSPEGTLEWEKKLGGEDDDGAQCVLQTVDGGYLIAGYTESNNTGDVSGNHSQYYSGGSFYGADIWMVKTDATGNVQWKKCYGGLHSEEPYSMQQTADNGFIVAGKSNSNNTGDVAAGNGINGSDDGWIVKLSEATLTTTTFKTAQLALYPNPATGMIHIDAQKPIRSFTIVDVLGNSVKQGNATSADVSDLSSGIYILKAITSEGLLLSQKFIKQ